MKKAGGMKFNLFFLLSAAIPSFISILVIAIVAVHSISNELKGYIYDQLHVASTQVNEYFVYDVKANGFVDYDEYADHDYMESLKKQEIELTLFQDDTRFLTSIKKEDGTYFEGSKADPKVVDAVRAGNNYSADDIVIGGTRYFVFYEPIYDETGSLWGMSFAGKPYSYYTNALTPMITIVIIVCIIMFIVLLVIMCAVGSRIAKSLDVTSKNLRAMSEGDPDVKFSEHTVIREFNDIIDSLDLMQSRRRDTNEK